MEYALFQSKIIMAQTMHTISRSRNDKNRWFFLVAGAGAAATAAAAAVITNTFDIFMLTGCM